MEKQNMPPTYEEVMQQPSAPQFDGTAPVHSQGMYPQFNPGMSQQPSYPQYPSLQQPVTAQPMIQPLQAAQNTIVVINQQITLRDSPVFLICPHCKQQTTTKIEHTVNWVTHLVAGALCIMGWCPCALIPYCSDCLKDVQHNCSKCSGYIGTYRKSCTR